MGKTHSRKQRDRLHRRIADAVAAGDKKLEAALRQELRRYEDDPFWGESEGERQAKHLYGGSRWRL